jgi:drug/metabolite transporter (DMT)-like permease
MTDTTQTPVAGASARTIGTFAVAVTLGGANFLAVRFSNAELPPFWGAGLRFALAGLAFTLVASGLRLRWPRGRSLVQTGVYGLFSFALSYALMYWALVRVTAGVATVVLAVVPLVTLLLSAAQGLERLRPRTVAGSLLAVAGIVAMTLGSEALILPLDGLVAMLAASLTIGQSVILGKKVSGNHPAVTNAAGMMMAAPVLLAISAVAGEQWALPTQTETIAAVAYLVTFGSVGLFVLVLLVVRRWTPSATSYMFVLFPVVTMLLGAWLADEPITTAGVVGAVVVMSGVWFGALAPSARRPVQTDLSGPRPAADPAKG